MTPRLRTVGSMSRTSGALRLCRMLVRLTDSRSCGMNIRVIALAPSMGTGPPPGSGDGGSSLIGWVGRRPDLVGVGVEVRAGRGAAQKSLGPEDGPGAAAPSSTDRQAQPALQGAITLDAPADEQAAHCELGEAQSTYFATADHQ